MSLRNLPNVTITARTGVTSRIAPKAFDRWSPDVRAAEEAEASTISILDPIGSDGWSEGVTARRIAGALRAIGERPVTVSINSPGGDFFEGLAIYNLLREHPAEVTVKVVGLAASAASVIAMAGDQIRIARAGFLMIHNCWVVAAGNRHQFREVADWLEPFDAAAVDVYAARSGLPAKEIAAMLDAETFIGGQAAVDKGLADALLTSDEIAQAPAAENARALRAERQFDLIAKQSGLSRTNARALLSDLKDLGTPGAADAPQAGTADIVEGLQSLLSQMDGL